MLSIDLNDRVAIVTGAGSGIGRGQAQAMARQGARIVVLDRLEERVRETVRLVEESGGTARPAVADITREDEVLAAVADTMDAWGRIDILCNNAGKMDRMQVAPDCELATWEGVLKVNATGTFLMLRHVLPPMVAAGRGVILNTASASGLRGGSAGIAYTAAKHAVIGITRSVAAMHVQDGIRCNAICPGAVNTDFLATADGALDKTGMHRIAPVLAFMPPATEPSTIAEVALFLVSDAASYINGAILPVDAGWTAA